MLGDKRFIQTIQLRNLLSYGPDAEEIELKSLNVLIGPNASGKSNLIEAIGLLHATPTDISVPIRRGGGISEWLWKGSKETPTAIINVAIENPQESILLRHVIQFTDMNQRFFLGSESVEIADSSAPPNRVIYPYSEDVLGGDFNPKQSVLSQLRDSQIHPEITYLATQYPKINIFRDWELGRGAAPRKPQATDLIGDFLEDGTTGEVADNLALVVNDLQNQSNCWEPILEKFKTFYPLAEKITARVIGNTVLLMLHEKGLKEPIPATRWSDGMLRYLSLLTILCHPAPPPLVCIEEPELGLHPDILSDLAELLIESSHRTQLIVTTHSDILVSALSEVPESILVCERDERGTSMRRLQKEKLEEWLKKYSLGELWRIGELGGKRW